MRGISVRTKVFLLFAGASLLAVLPALVLIGREVERRVYERATQDLIGANEALRTYWSVQDEALQETAGRIALERGVPGLLRERDTTELRRVLSRRVSEGRVVVAADSAGARLLGPVLDSATLYEGGAAVVLPEGGGAPVRVAVWPVFAEAAPDTVASGEGEAAGLDLPPLSAGDSVQVGLVGVGARLDAVTIRSLRDVTGGVEVALVVGDSVVATTLPDSLIRILEQTDLPMVVERGGIWKRQVERLPYLYAVNALGTREVPSAILLFRPVAQELRLATGIWRSVVGVGLFALVLSLLLAALVSRIVARPAQALAAAAAELAEGNFDAPLPRASGDEIGQLTAAFGEMRSSIAEREARLRAAQSELIHREKLAAMGRLVAQLSHEINNPIYNIQNCLEVLQRRGDPEDPNREFLELAREELERMAVLTRQLLDQSRPLSESVTSVDVNQLVQRVATLASAELEASSVRLHLRLRPEPTRVTAHAEALQQVLANLVQNATDAMPGGGSLTIATSATAETVEIAVDDTGVGVPEADLPHIFEAFYTTKPGVRGIGLGLFVSEGIVRSHRGRLLVDSRPGRGSRFTIQLPRETLAPVSGPRSAPADGALAGGAD